MAQGKLDYVRRIKRADGEEPEVVDCTEWPISKCAVGALSAEIKIFYHFHEWVRNMVFAGVDVEQALMLFWRTYPNWIIISDEVGNGIVPLDKLERQYRECLGRILIEAAQRADRVERVICGLGQRIK